MKRSHMLEWWRMVQAWKELQSYFPGLHRSTVRDIIDKWKRLATIVNLHRVLWTATSHPRSQWRTERIQTLTPSGHFFYVYKVISWAPALHKERHYVQMEKTWNNSEPLQKWMTFQNSCKSTATSHPGSHKTSKQLQTSVTSINDSI